MFGYQIAADDAGDAVLALGSMNVKEMVLMLRDLCLINSLLTERAVVRIFNYVQQENDGDEDNEDSDTEMCYEEFLEAMVCDYNMRNQVSLVRY